MASSMNFYVFERSSTRSMHDTARGEARKGLCSQDRPYFQLCIRHDQGSCAVL